MLLSLLLALSPECASDQPVTLAFKATDSMERVAAWASKHLCEPYTVDAAVAKKLMPVSLAGSVPRSHAKALLGAALAATGVTLRPQNDGVVLGARVTTACDDAIPQVRVVDELTRSVSRAAFESNWSECMLLGARVVPALKDGAPSGIKLFAIRAPSLWAALGFRNGDTLVEVNGHALGSPEAALDAYGALKSVDELRFALERQGQRVTLTVKIEGPGHQKKH